MTIQDVLSRGIKEIRKPYWNSQARIILPQKFLDGNDGPHLLNLIDPPSGYPEDSPMKIIFTDDEEDDWEEFNS